jgi:hypothetical protein
MLHPAEGRIAWGWRYYSPPVSGVQPPLILPRAPVYAHSIAARKIWARSPDHGDSAIDFHLPYRIIWVQRNNAMVLPESR